MNAHTLASERAPRAATSGDFAILCLWSTFGIALSSLFLVAGLGLEITRGLGAAG